MRILNFLIGAWAIFAVDAIAAATNTNLPGISYKQYNPDNINIIHVLTVDPTKVKIIAARAQDLKSGLESVANIAQHYNAIAAINGGFFKFENAATGVGLPAGVLKLNNHWYGIAFKPRGAIGWDPKTKQVLMDRIQTKSKLSIADVELPIHALNRQASTNKAYLLTDSYTEQIEVAPHTAITINNSKVVALNVDGQTTVPTNGYVYHAGIQVQKLLSTIKIGDKANVQVTALPQLNPQQSKAWQQMPFIVGGGPLLIYDNRILHDFAVESQRNDFIYGKHARTAVGILPNKNWVMVVVEQQLLNEDTGMTIPELAKFMQSLGCVQALNLDGGGSSSMYVDPKIQASFNFIHRPVADAILVMLK